MIETICKRYGLGTPVGAPVRIAYDSPHTLWRLATESGAYLVKQLNPTVFGGCNAERHYEASERVAAAFAEAGLPVVAAYDTGHGPVEVLADGSLVMVYPWVDGRTLSFGPAPTSVAGRVGELLGELHACGLPAEVAPLTTTSLFEAAHWHALVAAGEAAEARWAPAARAMLPALTRWSDGAREALERTERRKVVSHADMHQGNVMWCDDDAPVLIDWESAGAVEPAMELLTVALHWSGASQGPPDREAFQAVIAGYARVSVPLSPTRDAYHEALAGWLRALELDMRRALGRTPDGDTATGVQLVEDSLAFLHRLEVGMDDHLRWVREAA